MTEFIGKVYEREIDYGNWIESISEVRDEKGDKLSDLLDEFTGKKVKITIEII